VHAHAVSSAFGLLGYHRGRTVLERGGQASADSRPATLLVQHMATSDMVLSLRHGGFDRDALPGYRRDAVTGLYHQDADEPEGEFTLEVVDASFPAKQTIAQPARMRLTVRNTDDRELPNLAVTVETEPGEDGAAPTAFGQAGTDPRLADPNRPVWIVDRDPEGGQTAYTNTWAIGRMFPGETKEIEVKLGERPLSAPTNGG